MAKIIPFDWAEYQTGEYELVASDGKPSLSTKVALRYGFTSASSYPFVDDNCETFSPTGKFYAHNEAHRLDLYLKRKKVKTPKLYRELKTQPKEGSFVRVWQVGDFLNSAYYRWRDGCLYLRDNHKGLWLSDFNDTLHSAAVKDSVRYIVKA